MVNLLKCKLIFFLTRKVKRKSSRAKLLLQFPPSRLSKDRKWKSLNPADLVMSKLKNGSYSSLNEPTSSGRKKLQKLQDNLTQIRQPLMAINYKVDESSGCCAKFGYMFTCPVHGKVAMWLTKIVGAITIWGTFWALTGDQALPGGNFFGLLVLIYGCVLAAAFVEVTPFPPLLGMLLVGFTLKNAPYVDEATKIDKKWASILRTIALVVILVRAGSGLDPNALKKVKWMAIRLAFVPSIAEAVAVAIMTRYTMNFAWIWSFVLGFVLSAVSPAVVVPSMIGVQERRLGVDEGIPTLCIASCSLNDVISISGFGVMLGIAFSHSNLVYNIFHGPLEILIGITFGVVAGVFQWYLPHKDSKNLLMYRIILVLSFGLLATFGFRVIKFPGAGALGTLTMSFVAGIGWRRRGWEHSYPIKPALAKFWQVFQPLLFGLIGNAVSIQNLKSGNIGVGVGTLFVGLFFRLVVTFFSSYGMNFSLKEKLFITLAWLPKATVQAAIGPIALDTAREKGADEEIIVWATNILTVAVLSILITAPIGAAGIATSAGFLLKRGGHDDIEGAVDINENKTEPKQEKEKEVIEVNDESSHSLIVSNGAENSNC